MTRVPTLDDYPMVNAAELVVEDTDVITKDGFYILIEGALSAAVSSVVQIGDIIVDYCYEFSPVVSSLPICPVDTPIPGIQTNAVATNMYSQYPSIQRMSADQAYRLADVISTQGPKDYDSFMRILA